MTSLVVFGIMLAASFLFAMLGLGGGMVYVPLLKWAGHDLKTVAIPHSPHRCGSAPPWTPAHQFRATLNPCSTGLEE